MNRKKKSTAVKNVAIIQIGKQKKKAKSKRSIKQQH